MNRRPARVRQLAAVLEAFALTSIALLLLSGYYGDNGWQAPTLGAALAGALVAWLGRIWQRGIAVVAAFVVVGGLVAAGALLLPAALRDGTAPATFLRSVLDAPVYGWSRMLTVGVPAATSAALLALPVALSWAASLTAASLSLSGRKVLAPLLPPFLLFVVTLMLSASHTGTRLGLTTAFLAVALLGAFGRANAVDHSRESDPEHSNNDRPAEDTVRADVRRFGSRSIPRLRLSGATLGVPIVVVVGGLGVAVAGALPAHGNPFDPSTVRAPAVDTVQMLNPLVSLKSVLSTKPARAVFTVRITSGAPVHDALRLRVASLDDFDGVTWTTTGHFTHPAAHLSPPAGGSLRGTKISLDVTVAGLPGTLLPVTGQPLELHATDAELDPPTGAVTVPGRTSLSGYTYRLTALLPVTDAGLQQDLPEVPADDQNSAELPAGLPPIVPATISAEASQGSFYNRLKSLEAYLYGLPYNFGHAPQESYAAVKGLLESGDKPFGFAEQHAAAFAVMARSLGLPTRIDVGYEVPAKLVTGGVITVNTQEAHAWDEVYFKGYGWVPFEPTKVDGAAPIQLPTSHDEVAPAGAGSTALVGGGTTTQTVHQHTGLSAWQKVVIGLLVALVLAALAVVLAKSWRRHRRRTADSPSRQVLGAWAEAIDQLIEASLSPSPSLSPEQIGSMVTDRVGPEAGAVMTRLSPLVDQAAFSDVPLDADNARQAWLCERELQRELRRHRPFATSWRWQVDPRPLLQRRGKARDRAEAGKQQDPPEPALGGPPP